MKKNNDENIQYEINDNEVPVSQEVIPEYATVTMLLKTKKIKVLVCEMLTNRCQQSFDNQSNKDKKRGNMTGVNKQ